MFTVVPARMHPVAVGTRVLHGAPTPKQLSSSSGTRMKRNGFIRSGVQPELVTISGVDRDVHTLGRNRLFREVQLLQRRLLEGSILVVIVVIVIARRGRLVRAEFGVA